MPQITVLIPVRNAGKYLEPSIDSVLQQSHSNLKLIIIDDHSSDQAIQKLKYDPRIKIFKNPGSGIIEALNYGLLHATNDSDCQYIARMDADDIAHPDRLKKQLSYQLENPDIDIIGAKVQMFGVKLGEGYRHYQNWINALVEPEEISRNIFVESPIPHPTAFAHKRIWKKLGGYKDHNWPEDYDLWLRAHRKNMRFGKPNEVLLDWRDHEFRLSRQDDRYAKKSFYRAKMHYLAQLNIARRYRVWGTGPTALMVHDELVKHNIEITGFIDIAEKTIGRNKRGKAVLNGWDIKKNKDFLLVAVASRGARDEIREHLNSLGFQEGLEYLCVA